MNDAKAVYENVRHGASPPWDSLLDHQRDLYNRMCLAARAPEPPPNTVRVRVAVAVDHREDWLAVGGSIIADQLAEDKARLGVRHHSTLYWLTADIPLPTAPATIQSRVEKA